MSEYLCESRRRRRKIGYGKYHDIVTEAESGAGVTVGAIQRGSPDRLPVIMSICRERDTSNGMPRFEWHGALASALRYEGTWH